MPKSELDQLLDHEYDGIREYDNPTPAWWYLLFAGTVLFSVPYFLFFQLGTAGWTVADSHQAAVADDLKLRFEEIGELTSDETTIRKYMDEPDWLAVGVTVFATHCKSCHAADGSGGVGPNLTDDNYKNVKTLVDVARVVEDGAANGSMPAWRNRLHPNEIVLVASYIATLRGQNLPGPRGAEGEVIPPWPADVADPIQQDAEAKAENTDDATPDTQNVGETQSEKETNHEGHEDGAESSEI